MFYLVQSTQLIDREATELSHWMRYGRYYARTLDYLNILERSQIRTFASIWEIWVAVMPFGTVAHVPWPVGGFHALAVGAEARVSARLIPFGDLTRHRPMSYSPVKHHGCSSHVCVVELGRGDV